MKIANRKRTGRQSVKTHLLKRLAFRRKPSKVGQSVKRNAETKRPIERASISYLLGILLIVVTVAGSFIFHLHVRFEGVHYGYKTSQARAERARLLVERRELRLELASLKAPQRVEAEAREKLGMEVPNHRRIIPIGKKKKHILASGGAR
jgi:cell division protein FtsL